MQVTLAQVPTESRAAMRNVQLRVLKWLVTLTSSIRVPTCMPAIGAIGAIAAIVSSGDSGQHSLWTWGAWLASTLAMAVWLWGHNGQCCNRAFSVNLGNAAMCAATVVVVSAHRF